LKNGISECRILIVQFFRLARAQFVQLFARHKEFREEYTLAHEFRAEDLAEEMVEIADDPSVLVETIAPQDVCAFEEPTTSMTGPCFFMPLNLIELNGDDLRRDPREVRKATLASVVAKPRPPTLQRAH
jgi:hypothetical protein